MNAVFVKGNTVQIGETTIVCKSRKEAIRAGKRIQAALYLYATEMWALVVDKLD